MAKRKRRMSAKQRMYFGKRRKRRSSSRKRRANLPAVLTNPSRRKRRRANPRAYKVSRRRRNPRLLGGGIVGQAIGTLIPAGIGAVGVLAVDRVIGYLPLTKLTTDPNKQKLINRAARLVAVAGVGIAARKFLGGERGNAVAAAAMGIAVHGILSTFVGSAPGLNGDGDLGAYGNSAAVLLEGDDMGEYISGEMDGDEFKPLISGEMDGDDLGEFIGADDLGADSLIGEYISGEE